MSVQSEMFALVNDLNNEVNKYEEEKREVQRQYLLARRELERKEFQLNDLKNKLLKDEEYKKILGRLIIEMYERKNEERKNILGQDNYYDIKTIKRCIDDGKIYIDYKNLWLIHTEGCSSIERRNLIHRGVHLTSLINIDEYIENYYIPKLNDLKKQKEDAEKKKIEDKRKLFEQLKKELGES